MAFDFLGFTEAKTGSNILSKKENVLGWVTAPGLLEALPGGQLEDSCLAAEGQWLPDGGAFVFLIKSSGLEAEVDSLAACLIPQGREVLFSSAWFSLWATNYLWENSFLTGGRTLCCLCKAIPLRLLLDLTAG